METMIMKSALRCAALAATLFALMTSATLAQTPQHDLLNATLMQRSVEYKANSIAIFALAKMRLDQALADKNWTGAPVEQTGAYQTCRPRLSDLDETLIDNSSGLDADERQGVHQAAWTQFVNSRLGGNSRALDFLKYADQKGVKLFYVSTARRKKKPARARTSSASASDGRQRRHVPDGAQADWGSARHAPRLRRQGLSRAADARQFRRLHRCLSRQRGEPESL
jgi:acid phosphatase